ncbi:MAG: UvrD-helicase domain-containing protein [Bryobacteraceae bacterium]
MQLHLRGVRRYRQDDYARSAVVEVLASGCKVEEIVAVTFTHAAAGEMKLRVRQKLEEAREQATDPITLGNLTHALQHLDRAFIGTIHAFCAMLLRSFPVEAEVDPRFQELSQSEALGLFGEVFRRWIEQKLSIASPVLRRALLRLTWSEEQGSDPLISLKLAAWKLVEWRDYPEPWLRREFDREQRLDALLAEVDAIDASGKALQPLADFASRARLSRELELRDDDTIESELLRLPGDLRWVKGAPAWEALKQSIERFASESGADLSWRLRDELWELARLYDEAKRRNGQIDFMDLLLRARDLLRKQDPRNQLQQRTDTFY